MFVATARDGSGGEIAGGDQQKKRGQEFGGRKFTGNAHCATDAVIMIASGPLQTGSAAALDDRTMTKAPAGGGHRGSTLTIRFCSPGCATAASAESNNPAAIPRITMRSLLLLLLYVFLLQSYADRNRHSARVQLQKFNCKASGRQCRALPASNPAGWCPIADRRNCGT